MFRTTILTALTGITFCFSAIANDEMPVLKTKAAVAKTNANNTSAKSTITSYAFKLNNAVNKNNQVDSVLVILDKYDRTGAGIVTKIFYPNQQNEIFIDELPAGKYYAEVFVLGMYQKHFSKIITVTSKAGSKNKTSLSLDFTEAYTSGAANIPAENVKKFIYLK
jgi:hypothetical protein